MTLRLVESWIGGMLPGKWGSTTPTGTRVSTPGFLRRPGSVCNTGGDALADLPAADEWFVGTAYRWNGSDNTTIILFRNGSTTHVTILKIGGVLQAKRGTTVLATGTTPINDGQWYYLEVRVKIADSGGVVQVRLDGSTSFDIDFAGDTKNGSTTTVNGIWIFSVGGGLDGLSMTDHYIADTSGAVNNSWLGDCQVLPLAPDGDGAHSDWVGSDGNSVNNSLLVDEQPASPADYVASSTVGAMDTYTVADLTDSVSAVLGVQVCASLGKDDSGARTANVVTRSSTTEDLSSAVTLTTTQTVAKKIHEVDPATSAVWTEAAVNALQVGVKVAS